MFDLFLVWNLLTLELLFLTATYIWITCCIKTQTESFLHITSPFTRKKATLTVDLQKKMGKKGGERRDSSFHMMLPEGCLAKVLSFTSPRDACRLSVVSSLFKSAADSDIVWKSFSPHDYRSIISQSNSSLQLASVTSSMKELYLNLCDKPILIENWERYVFLLMNEFIYIIRQLWH